MPARFRAFESLTCTVASYELGKYTPKGQGFSLLGLDERR